MSSFTVPIEVAATSEGPFVQIDAVVDTGAFYSWVPRAILGRLGIKPVEVQAFGLAEGGIVHRAIAEVVVRLAGRSRHTVCVFGDEGTESLLGAVTLEEFAFGVDPVNGRLPPMPKLGMLGNRPVG